MKTKEKIIKISLDLFNAYGIEQVSLRQIAAEAKISHSNLAYHYKSKNDILHEIYTQMDQEMANAVFPEEDHSLMHYHKLLQRISAFQKCHAFFYMDLLTIARKYPEVIIRYRQTINQRSEQYEVLIGYFVRKKLIKPEQEPGFYKSLFHSIWVMSTFWLQQAKILGEDHPLIQSGNDIKHVWEILLPHLTPDGLWQYQLFINQEELAQSPIQKQYLNQLDT